VLQVLQEGHPQQRGAGAQQQARRDGVPGGVEGVLRVDGDALGDAVHLELHRQQHEVCHIAQVPRRRRHVPATHQCALLQEVRGGPVRTVRRMCRVHGVLQLPRAAFHCGGAAPLLRQHAVSARGARAPSGGVPGQLSHKGCCAAAFAYDSDFVCDADAHSQRHRHREVRRCPLSGVFNQGSGHD
tara:strand:+ start:1243 stop:1797 length:555 start_codon:yes stop_codon:yes gene_type:complete